MPHQNHIEIKPGDWTLVATGVEYVRIQRLGGYQKLARICVTTNKPEKSNQAIGDIINNPLDYWESPPGLSASDSVYARPRRDDENVYLSVYTGASA